MDERRVAILVPLFQPTVFACRMGLVALREIWNVYYLWCFQWLVLERYQPAHLAATFASTADHAIRKPFSEHDQRAIGAKFHRAFPSCGAGQGYFAAPAHSGILGL